MANYNKFQFNSDEYIITKTVTKYKRTDSGKCWKSRPESVETEIVSAEHYENYVQSIPFFNDYGHGAYCRATHSYTAAGYLPTKIVSVSPFEEVKIVAEFRFDSK